MQELKSPKKKKKVLQKFDGTVVSVTKTSFGARLIDLTNPKNPEEFGTIPLKVLKDSEKPFVEPGAIFMWKIFHGGGMSIRFSRLRWTEKDLKRAKKEAKKIQDLFGWKSNANQI
jgi:hypothetical protein